MKYTASFFQMLAVAVAIIVTSSNTTAQEIQAPSSYFGFEPGSDGNLFNYDELIGYLQLLEEKSGRIHLEEIGTSPMGKKMYIAFISLEKNIERLSEFKEINRELALNPDIGENERQQYINEGKVFVLSTLSMHSSEVGPAQSAPLIAYDLATTGDDKKLQWLNDVVLMMVPNHNPDGMDKVVDNYNKYKGTKYDGASLPDVYHKYVGHDNNRDFVILSQEDTKAIAAIYNLTWFPQVMVEKHQMGSTGVRFFVPPNHDPIAENVPGELYSWAGLFGHNMANDLTGQGLAGVAQHYLFDDYWPGSTETCIWKNVIGFLTEAASARTASPIYIEPNELRAGGKGLSEYEKSVNMLLPWEGGWWHLSDIIEYETVSTLSVLKTASLYRQEILQFRNDLCREMVEKGRTEAPYYYILPREQHDAGELVNMVVLLKEHGVDVYELQKELVVEDIAYRRADLVVPLAQPFRAFIKEVMEEQEFPERHYTPGGELIRPYDITSWSLPLHRYVKSFEVNTRDTDLENNIKLIEGDFSMKERPDTNAVAVILSANYNESFKTAFNAVEQGFEVRRMIDDIDMNGHQIPKGSFLISMDGRNSEQVRSFIEQANYPVISVPEGLDIQAVEMEVPRIALIETYFHDMDAGWTRFIFDTYHIPYKKIRPHEIKDADIEKNYDIVIFPDENKSLLMEGKYKSGEDYYQGNYHPDYTKGIGKEGLQALLNFIEEGGVIISWGQSTALFEGTLKLNDGDDVTEEFSLPFTDIAADLRKEGLYIPGSLLKISLLKDHPLTIGMPVEVGVFSRGRPVFRTSLPGFDMDRRVIATYAEKDVLMSGYAAGEDHIEDKSAMIWLKKGDGQLVLFGFNPQFRASTQASFKLLFNAILL
ncbi:MAG: hypothetical protein K9J30_01975 [Bacteroidales bacterium]|nr:hypothetical protein [Bacteroidales bacterium]